MEPIISPWTVYFLNIIESLGIALTIIMVGLGILLIASALFAIIVSTDNDPIPDIIKKTWKKALYTFLALLMFLVFLPSQKTLIAMIVAKNITPVNVEKALKTGKDFKNEIKKDILDLIQTIQKGDGGKK